MKKPKIPKYRKHKGSGQAAVTLDGENKYLGRYGTQESREKYDRLVGEWLQAKGLPAPRKLATRRVIRNITVVEAADKYWTYVTENHGPGERARVHAVLQCLIAHYENEHAAEIGPAELRELRTEMISKGWSRSYINDLIATLKRMYKWLAAEPLIPITTYQSLLVVGGLRRGHGGVRETTPVPPVMDEIVDATVKKLPKVVADMVRLQRLTGMRPNEVCILRPSDLDRTSVDRVWIYRPSAHKTEHFGKERTVCIGPKAQAILEPYLDRDPQEYCFQPRESEAQRRVARGRGTKHVEYSDHYDSCTYRRAIHRACDKAFPHPTISGKDLTAKESEELKKWQKEHRWSPNRLRHTAATEIRREFGLEAAQIALGHSRADVTQIYAERDLTKGIEVAKKLG